LTLSKRHHYIPEFFIKAFTDENGKLAVFNKEKGIIEPHKKSPRQVFFEWHRNTFNIKGKETDFVEKIYQFSEDKFSPTFRKLTEKQEPVELEAFELFHLMQFISEIHWRVPNQDQSAIEYSKNSNSDNSSFQLKNKNTGELAPLKIFNQIIKQPAFVETMKMIRSLEEVTEISKNDSLRDWKIYYVPKDSVQLHLLGDNPLILRKKEQINILKSELIFPLSKGKTVYHTKGKVINSIPADNRLSIDLLTFIQAEKLVCGPNAEYLKSISTLALLYNTPDRIDLLKEKVFEVFK